MGDQGAHAEVGGQGHRGPVVRIGRGLVAMARLRSHLAQEAEGSRLVAALAALARECDCGRRLPRGVVGARTAEGP
jgi:hypothetical protein